MKLFLDTANLDEIRAIKKWGVLSGATTNPSLLSKEHSNWELQMKEVCTEVDGDVSLETTEKKADDIYEEGLKLASVAPNVVVKVVMTPDGLEAGKRLVDHDIPINVTLTFSPAQAILAAIRRAGNGLAAAIGNRIQLLLTDAVQPPVTTEPKIAARVVYNLKHVLIEKPLRGGDAVETALLEAAQTAFKRANP